MTEARNVALESIRQHVETSTVTENAAWKTVSSRGDIESFYGPSEEPLYRPKTK